MKVLVTGATGFIGNYVVDELLKYNCDVVAVANVLGEDASRCQWFDMVDYIEYDLKTRQDNFFSFFENPDLLIHLAWEGLPNYKELFHIEKNLFSGYYFIKNMVENGLKDLSIIGTCLEYGIRNGCLSEDTETSPATAYALAKDTLRKFVCELKKNYNFNYKWIRLFYMYGKGQNENSLFSQLDKAIEQDEKILNMSGGEQLRDYLPVEMVAEYIVKISLQQKYYGIFNCCSGKPVSIRKFAEEYLKSKGKSIELNFGYYPYSDYEPMAFWGDDTKLKKVLEIYK